MKNKSLQKSQFWKQLYADEDYLQKFWDDVGWGFSAQISEMSIHSVTAHLCSYSLCAFTHVILVYNFLTILFFIFIFCLPKSYPGQRVYL